MQVYSYRDVLTALMALDHLDNIGFAYSPDGPVRIEDHEGRLLMEVPKAVLGLYDLLRTTINKNYPELESHNEEQYGMLSVETEFNVAEPMTYGSIPNIINEINSEFMEKLGPEEYNKTKIDYSIEVLKRNNNSVFMCIVDQGLGRYMWMKLTNVKDFSLKHEHKMVVTGQDGTTKTVIMEDFSWDHPGYKIEKELSFEEIPNDFCAISKSGEALGMVREPGEGTDYPNREDLGQDDD